MIPDGTPPEAIVAVVVITTLVGCMLMAALFWYRVPPAWRAALGSLVSGLFAARPASAPPPASRQTQTDEADRRETVGISAIDQILDRLEVDRTMTPIIEVLLYKGWTVGEIRSRLKGDNGVIGAEIDAARKRLGMAPSAGYQTPVAGRPTDAKFQDALN